MKKTYNTTIGIRVVGPDKKECWIEVSVPQFEDINEMLKMINGGMILKLVNNHLRSHARIKAKRDYVKTQKLFKGYTQTKNSSQRENFLYEFLRIDEIKMLLNIVNKVDKDHILYVLKKIIADVNE